MKLVLTRLEPEQVWLLNFGKFNSEDDIIITKEIAHEILRLQSLDKKEYEEKK